MRISQIVKLLRGCHTTLDPERALLFSSSDICDCKHSAEADSKSAASAHDDVLTNELVREFLVQIG